MAINERHFPLGEVGDERLRQAIQILTTEHYTLQSGRASTIAEATGRVSMFLTSTSGSLIAIAFIGQVSNLGLTFRVFTLLLLPTLLLLGVVTFVRAAQSATEDGLYVSGINRIRHFYVEVVPEIADYFVLSTHDDWEGRMASASIPWSRWQPLFSIPFMVAAINGVLAGALLALLSTWMLDWPLALSVAVGLAGAGALLAMQIRQARRNISRFQRKAALFPTPHPESRL